MQETYQLTAIILNSATFRERDSRITVFSHEAGLGSLVVRGGKAPRSRLAGHAEPLCLVDLMAVRGRHFDYVGGARARNCHGNIRADFEKILAASLVARAVMASTKENEPIEGLFGLLESFLSSLDGSARESAGYRLESATFLFKLCALLGFQPETRNCLDCGRKILPVENYFSISKGGLLCPDCAAPDRAILDPGDVKILRFILREDFDKISRLRAGDAQAETIFALAKSYADFHILH